MPTATIASRPSSPTWPRWPRSARPPTRSWPTEPRLDVVIDNAGAIFPERIESPDGFEATFATLVLGPFALIAGLLPLLRSTGGARVVAVTSGGMYAQRLRLDDLQWERASFDGARVYAHAKRAQVALVREWARRVPVEEVAFNAMHPGWADTPGISAALPRFYGLMAPILRTPAEGADTTVWLAADPAAAGRTGRSVPGSATRGRSTACPTTRVSADDRRRLWDCVVALTGVTDPASAAGPIAAPPPSTTQGATDMTRIHERIATTLPIEAAFDYVADFANSQQWDPGTTSSRRMDAGPVGVGARYALTVRMGGRVGPDGVPHPRLRSAATGRPRRRRVRTSTPSTTSGSSASATAPSSTTPRTSALVGCCASPSRSSARRSRRSAATRRPGWTRHSTTCAARRDEAAR